MTAVTTPREKDEFRRIQLATELDRARKLVAQYDEHQSYYRAVIEDHRYELGRLDERLGDSR
jgi:hypothetical protein